MADKKITELTELTSASLNDIFAVVDIAGSETKKINVENYITNVRNHEVPLTASAIRVTDNIVPKTAQGATLGTAALPFSSLYVSSGSIFVESDTPGDDPGIIKNIGSDISIDSAGFRLVSASTTPFRLFKEGIITVRTNYQDPTSRPLFEIIGNLEGSASLAVNPGTLLQTTAYDGESNRTIFDSYGSASFSQLNLRSANGSVYNPTTNTAGVIGRIGSSGWVNGIDFGVPGETALPTRIDFYGEGYASGSRPTSIKMYTTDSGSLDPDGTSSLELTKDSLYVLGQLSASLTNEHVWIGDSNDRNIEISASALATYLTESFITPSETGSFLTTSSLNYGAFLDTTTQSGSANTAYAVKHNTTTLSRGVTITNGTRITVDKTGVYNLISTIQFVKTNTGQANMSSWFRKNGTDIATSATDLLLAGSNQKNLYAINLMETLTSGSYIEIMWSADDANVTLHYTGSRSNPTRPAVPSVITTITQVS